VTGTLLTTGDTRADEKETLGLELLGSADRVGVVRVTTVNDDVALLKVGDELVDESVNGGTGLDEKDHLAGALELGDKLLDGLGANDVGACAISGKSGTSRRHRRVVQVQNGTTEQGKRFSRIRKAGDGEDERSVYWSFINRTRQALFLAP